MPRENDVTITIHATMRKRWVPHFVSMLRYMESLGNSGASRRVTIYADGDGDFQPKFKFEGGPIVDEEVPPARDDRGDRFYDAG